MGTGYTRNDTANNIADGNVINASDLDGEFDAIQAAFNATTGHSHDGTTGEGPQIGTGGIADSAVTTAKINDANVTLAKMAANSVDSDQYVDGSIDTAHIGNLQVTTAKIAADAIDGTKLADNAVDSEHYTDGSIDRVHLAADIVDGTKIADDSIDSEHYVDGSIDTAHIANDAVTGDKLANNIQIAGTLGVTGETTLSTHLNMGDNDIIKLGASADLQIYHDGLNSYIYENGTGSLYLSSNGNGVNIRGTHGEDGIVVNANADVELYYDNAKKLETTSTGVSVTGNVVVSGTVDGRDVATDGTKLDGIESGATADQTASEILTLIKTVDGSGSGLDADTLDGVSSGSFLRSDAADTKTSGDLLFSDNVKAKFGSSADLEIYHSGSHSFIHDNGTGSLYIDATQLNFRNGAQNATYADFTNGGAARLMHNGNVKFETKSDGVDITGELQADSLDIDGAADITGVVALHNHLELDDNDEIRLGNSDDLKIYHNGSHSYIQDSGTGNLTVLAGNLYINNAADSETMLSAVNNGAVSLYYDNSLKLETTTYGIHVDGTGAAAVPSGTTAQRPTGVQGQIRYNTSESSFEGYDGSAWGELGGAGGGLFKGENGEVGSSAGDIFRVHEQTLNTNVTIDSDENGLCAGPLTIATGVTLTVNGNLSIV